MTMAATGPLGQWFADLTQSVRQSDPVAVGFGIALLAGAAAFAAWRAWRDLHSARTIEDIPTSKIRSAPMGYIELEGAGKLMDGPPIVAPLSGLPCVWYRYRVEEQVTTYNRGRAQRRWQVVDKGESTETFWLEDDTGRVVIDPEGAEVTPKHKDVWHSSSGMSRAPLRTNFITAFLAAHTSGNPHRFTEWRINPGEELYALGLLKNLGSLMGHTTVDEDVRGLLQEWKRDQAALKERFDLNQDGRIDEKEWMLARAQARREVLRARTEQQQTFSEGINLVGPTNDSSRPYILSAYPQADIVKRYQLWAGLYGAGFFLLGSAGGWLFNTRFG